MDDHGQNMKNDNEDDDEHGNEHNDNDKGDDEVNLLCDLTIQTDQ